MRRRPIPAAIAAAAALCVAACAAGAAAPSSQVAEPGAVAAWTEAEEPLSVTMRSVAERLELAGLKPSAITLRAFVSAGERRSFPLTLPPHTCATLVALASAGVADIDAALYAPDGDLLGVDSQPDAHPTLQVCALEQARSLYYVLHAYDGAGTVLMVGFVGPRDSLEAAARMLGGQPALARGSQSEVGELDRVVSFSDAVRRRGFRARSAPLGVPIDAGQAVRVGIGVRAGGCYTAAGFPEDGLGTLSLRVLDDEGAELIVGERTLQDGAAAQFCTDRTADYFVELSGDQGFGRAQLLLYEADAQEVHGERGLWLGDSTSRALARQDLDTLLDATLARARSDGYPERIVEQRGRLGPGEVQVHALELPGQRCSRVVLQGGRGLGRLELRVQDGAGRELARASGQAGAARLHLCPPAHALRLQVTALGGQGPYALVVLAPSSASAQPPSSPAVATHQEPDRGLRLELEQQAREAGFTALGGFDAGPRRVELPAGSGPTSIGLPLGAGRCLRVYALAPGETQVTARFEHDGQSITASSRPTGPLRVCAEPSSARTLKLTLSAAKQASVWLWAFERAAPPGSPLRL